MTIEQLLDQFIATYAELEPVDATRLGLDGHDHRLADLTREGIARAEAWQDDMLARFRAMSDDGLTLDERIDRDLVISHLRGQMVMRDWQAWRRRPAIYVAEPLEGVFALFLHRSLPEPELIDAAVARLHATPLVLEAATANLDPALASRVAVERAVDSCHAAISYCRDTVPSEIEDPSGRLAEACEVAARAYEGFLPFLSDLRDKATGDFAIGHERYSGLLLEAEMLGYGVHEMLERGRAAYDELSAEMSRRAQEMRDTDDWTKVVEELNADHPRTPEEMRDAYEDWTERARRFLIERGLVTLPDGERCLVEPSPPFQRPIQAVASYDSPQMFKPSLIGHFYVPYPPDGDPPDQVQKRLSSNSFASIPTVAVHEAYPGHHWHLISMLRSRPVRRVVGSAYFVEGWGLYSELLMMEQGFYDDPRHEMGVLNARIFRAARIIVDTSLHIGAMNVDEAVDFMMNAGLSEPTARAEVGRYCSWPTQASSYLTGSLEIERMRKRWLGEKRGDLRAFHDKIAQSGALPIALCERALFDARA